MRAFAVVLALLVSVSSVGAQQPKKEPKPGSKTPITYENERYQVKVTAPAGWTKAWEGPAAKGNWVNLVRFEDPRTGATASLSSSATHYRSGAEMIRELRKQFDKDSRIAILRREEMGATSRRPKGVFFEYTMQGKDGPVHAVATYFLHLSRRYRVYANVREAGWRSAAPRRARTCASSPPLWACSSACTWRRRASSCARTCSD